MSEVVGLSQSMTLKEARLEDTKAGGSSVPVHPKKVAAG